MKSNMADESTVTFDVIRDHAEAFGADLVGIAPVRTWSAILETQQNLHPAAVWPQARSVIAMALRIRDNSDLVEARLLDEAAYRLAFWLSELGFPSVHIPCDAEEENYIANAAMSLFPPDGQDN